MDLKEAFEREPLVHECGRFCCDLRCKIKQN